MLSKAELELLAGLAKIGVTKGKQFLESLDAKPAQQPEHAAAQAQQAPSSVSVINNSHKSHNCACATDTVAAPVQVQDIIQALETWFLEQTHTDNGPFKVTNVDWPLPPGKAGFYANNLEVEIDGHLFDIRVVRRK